MGCVYCATCSVNGKQYIGKTKHDLNTRQTQHQNQASTKRRSLFHKALYKYGKNAFQWDVLFESNDELVLYQKERDFIKELKTIAPTGYNLTSGGDGNYNVQFDDEWKEKNQKRADALGRSVYCVETDTIYVSMAEASRILNIPVGVVRHSRTSVKHLTYSGLHFCNANESEIIELQTKKAAGLLVKKLERSPEFVEKMRQRMLGRKQSPEFCEKRRQIMSTNNPWKGKHPSIESLQKMSENRKGLLVGEENPSARTIQCVELDRIFCTMKDAAEALGLPKAATSNISSCCSGKLKTAYGYHWRYADDI